MQPVTTLWEVLLAWSLIVVPAALFGLAAIKWGVYSEPEPVRVHTLDV